MPPLVIFTPAIRAQDALPHEFAVRARFVSRRPRGFAPRAGNCGTDFIHALEGRCPSVSLASSNATWRRGREHKYDQSQSACPRSMVRNLAPIIHRRFHFQMLKREFLTPVTSWICYSLGKITWHMFRHTFASRLTREGVDIVTVRIYLGIPTSAPPCATLTPTMMRSAGAVQRLKSSDKQWQSFHAKRRSQYNVGTSTRTC